jgi:predicted O-linked N-acetylglucosamine transferase (SPINDLY family)
MEADLPVNELPAIKNDHLTFGCLNNYCKVNEPLLKMWGQVLAAVPTARFLLLCPAGAHRANVVRALGIDESRIEFVGRRHRRDYLQLYHRVDLCLDTFPYNGHTTSLDALWMGVPVVTLCGERVVSRAGYSQMVNLGLEELVTRTPAEFVEFAISLGGDLVKLSRLRKTLRRRMEASPLMDAARFARNMEMAYRAMWRRWCESTAP